jgi:hypothetical protein
MAGLCTGDGPCDPSPTGTGKNWVTKNGGLPLYIRAVAHSLKRAGMSEMQAVVLAIGVIRRWASGKGTVTAATRARAAKALAEWDALKARSHSHTAGRSDTVDLSLTSVSDGPRVTVNDMLKTPAACRAAAKNLHKLPAPLRAKMRKRIAVRAKQLQMGDVGLSQTYIDELVDRAAALLDLSVTAEQRKNAKVTYPGTDKFPISNQADFNKAWALRNNSSLPDGKVEAWLRGVAQRMGFRIPGGAM